MSYKLLRNEDDYPPEHSGRIIRSVESGHCEPPCHPGEPVHFGDRLSKKQSFSSDSPPSLRSNDSPPLGEKSRPESPVFRQRQPWNILDQASKITDNEGLRKKREKKKRIDSRKEKNVKHSYKSESKAFDIDEILESLGEANNSKKTKKKVQQPADNKQSKKKKSNRKDCDEDKGSSTNKSKPDDEEEHGNNSEVDEDQPKLEMDEYVPKASSKDVTFSSSKVVVIDDEYETLPDDLNQQQGHCNDNLDFTEVTKKKGKKKGSPTEEMQQLPPVKLAPASSRPEGKRTALLHSSGRQPGYPQDSSKFSSDVTKPGPGKSYPLPPTASSVQAKPPASTLPKLQPQSTQGPTADFDSTTDFPPLQITESENDGDKTSSENSASSATWHVMKSSDESAVIDVNKRIVHHDQPDIQKVPGGVGGPPDITLSSRLAKAVHSKLPDIASQALSREVDCSSTETSREGSGEHTPSSLPDSIGSASKDEETLVDQDPALILEKGKGTCQERASVLIKGVPSGAWSKSGNHELEFGFDLNETLISKDRTNHDSSPLMDNAILGYSETQPIQENRSLPQPVGSHSSPPKNLISDLTNVLFSEGRKVNPSDDTKISPSEPNFDLVNYVQIVNMLSKSWKLVEKELRSKNCRAVYVYPSQLNKTKCSKT